VVYTYLLGAHRQQLLFLKVETSIERIEVCT
jgi:hypothetical protein